MSEGQGEGSEAIENCQGLTLQVLVGGGWESGFYCMYEKPGEFLPGYDVQKITLAPQWELREEG